jgi:hypothetical protein
MAAVLALGLLAIGRSSTPAHADPPLPPDQELIADDLIAEGVVEILEPYVPDPSAARDTGGGN